MVVNGRAARYYTDDAPSATRFYLPVTYHRCVNSKLRQLTVSPRLLKTVLR